MSNIAPEGVPVPIPDAPVAAPAPDPLAPVVTQVVQEVQKGLATEHVAGGGFGGVVAAVVVAVCNRYHVHVSDVDATIVGSVALSAGVGLGHVFAKYGVFPAVKRFFLGSRA